MKLYLAFIVRVEPDVTAGMFSTFLAITPPKKALALFGVWKTLEEAQEAIPEFVPNTGKQDPTNANHTFFYMEIDV